MKIKSFVLGLVSTNCYVVENESIKECVIVDPAAYSPKVIDYMKEEGIELKAILLTHGHFDHTMGLDKLLKEFPVPVYAHEAEAELLGDTRLNLSAKFRFAYTFTDADYVADGEVLKLAGMEFEVLYTPGHTAGSCCYYMREENVLFSGDTLFQASVGRTDFPTGDQDRLLRSLKDKLLTLPEATKVYPGHMKETTIEYEKKNNPYF